jgi:hypothetical protein
MAASPETALVSQYSPTPLSHVVLGLTLAVVISGETAMPGDIAPDISLRHVAVVGEELAGSSWHGVGERIARQLGVLNAFL